MEPFADSTNLSQGLRDAKAAQVYLHQGYTIYYTECAATANTVLRSITEGSILGFDVEFDTQVQPPFSPAEVAVLKATNMLSPFLLRGAQLALFLLQRQSPNAFEIVWDHVRICTVQISMGKEVWVLGLTKMRNLPSEVKRILESPNIVKVACATLSQVKYLWEDLNIDVQNIIDVGLMTRLCFPHYLPIQGFGPLSLQESSRMILGRETEKGDLCSDWQRAQPTKKQIQCAGMEAALPVQIFEIADEKLHATRSRYGCLCPTWWYTLHGTFGSIAHGKSDDTRVALWNLSTCHWFSKGKFQGYT
ncbi:hypothetical protein MKEN_01018600 [Mycena kentingensis (nom. inval.)]|nr:hypothetical protein MKEN_01018600 [Mycena kentingensis (nom. inval.)]